MRANSPLTSWVRDSSQRGSRSLSCRRCCRCKQMETGDIAGETGKQVILRVTGAHCRWRETPVGHCPFGQFGELFGAPFWRRIIQAFACYSPLTRMVWGTYAVKIEVQMGICLCLGGCEGLRCFVAFMDLHDDDLKNVIKLAWKKCPRVRGCNWYLGNDQIEVSCTANVLPLHGWGVTCLGRHSHSLHCCNNPMWKDLKDSPDGQT